MRLPILIIHICGGVIGLLSGVAAVSFRKGSPRHRKAGNIFFISMLTMAVYERKSVPSSGDVHSLPT